MPTFPKEVKARSQESQRGKKRPETTKNGWQYKVYGSVPDGWYNFSRMGSVVYATPFLPFKVPLTPEYTQAKPEEQFDLEDLFNSGYGIGMIVDLTFTNRYYDRSRVWKTYSARYVKIKCGGHNVEEQNEKYLEFREAVRNYWLYQGHRAPQKMIGVHCTHGINRTGYMICRFLIEECGWDADTAIQAFGVARGHPIERDNYIEDLKRISDSLGRGQLTPTA
ncbi:hypothetical protein L596_026457 [Steinernema carpocapsae]|nr:hypothetical protein L596_026457 [Steinernema carpocapsae]